MLGIGDIVMPGLLLCFVLRYDNYKKQANGDSCSASGPANISGRMQKVSYFHCTLIGYFVGLLTATVASRIHRAAQPALLYLVPFTLLPLLTMAYLKGDLRRMWSEPFHSKSSSSRFLEVWWITESDQMASKSFSVNSWFCFLLELAWYLEMYLSKDCCVTGFCICRSEVLEPCVVLSLPAVGVVEPLLKGQALPSAPSSPIFMDLHQTVTSGGWRCDCWNWHRQGVVLYLWTLKGWETLANWFLQWTLKNFGTSFLWGTQFQRTETEALLSLYSFLFLDLLNIFCGVKWLIKSTDIEWLLTTYTQESVVISSCPPGYVGSEQGHGFYTYIPTHTCT